MLTENICFFQMQKPAAVLPEHFGSCSFSEVLKRLDDASGEVRLAAAHTLANWFKCLKDSDVKSSMENHVEFLYQELLVHLDDPDENLQKAVLGKNFSPSIFLTIFFKSSFWVFYR